MTTTYETVWDLENSPEFKKYFQPPPKHKMSSGEYADWAWGNFMRLPAEIREQWNQLKTKEKSQIKNAFRM